MTKKNFHKKYLVLGFVATFVILSGVVLASFFTTPVKSALYYRLGNTEQYFSIFTTGQDTVLRTKTAVEKLNVELKEPIADFSLYTRVELPDDWAKVKAVNIFLNNTNVCSFASVDINKSNLLPCRLGNLAVGDKLRAEITYVGRAVGQNVVVFKFSTGGASLNYQSGMDWLNPEVGMTLFTVAK